MEDRGACWEGKSRPNGVQSVGDVVDSVNSLWNAIDGERGLFERCGECFDCNSTRNNPNPPKLEQQLLLNTL